MLNGMHQTESALDPLLEKRKILVFVGSGGVGKTTGSAAIAIRAAALGHRTIVVTVDPARRLANALGMAKMPKKPVDLDLPDEFDGTLTALMFDAQTTFDEVVQRNAASSEVADRILNNKFYRTASSSLAGAHEYMAMERLLMLHESGDYDRIILDTPPSVHALDFLKAPDKLLSFLEHSTTRVVMKARSATKRRGGFFRPGGMIARGVSRFVGGDFFIELMDFIQSFESMYPGFRERAARIQRILRSDETGIVVVHAPEEATLREATRFDELLRQSGHSVVAFVANRVHLSSTFDADKAGKSLEEALMHHAVMERFSKRTRQEILHKMNALHTDMEFLSQQDLDALGRIQKRAQRHNPPVPLYLVPHFDRDIHDLEGLNRFAGSALAADLS